MVDSVSGAVVQAGGRTFITGQGSGLDFTALIQAAYDQKIRAADRLDVTVSENNSKIDAFNELNTLLKNVESSISQFASSFDVLGLETNIFDDRVASIESDGSSDPLSFIDVSIDPGAAISSYDLEVVAVGEAQQVISDGANGSFADITSAAGKGSATFELGLVGGATATVTFDNNSSLQDIVDSINAVSATSQVSASIVSLDGGATYQFILEAQDSGADFQFVDTSGTDGFELLGITDAGDNYVNEIQAASQASILFEGIPVTQNSNTFDTLVQGVEFTVKNATAGEVLTIDVQNDAATVRSELDNFITAYNELRDFVFQNQQVSADGTVADNAQLFSESILESVSSRVQSLLSLNYSTSAGFETLAELGITLDAQNRLEITDSAALDDALLNNFDSFAQLFESRATIDSSELRLTKNENLQGSLSFALDITSDGTNITSVSVGGDTSLFTFTNNTIEGAEGTIYEGLRLSYVGTTSQTINVDINNGYGNLLTNTIDLFADEVTGDIINEIARLQDENTDLQLEIGEITERAEDFRDNEIDRLAALEAEIARAQIIIDQIRAIVNAGQDD